MHRLAIYCVTIALFIRSECLAKDPVVEIYFDFTDCGDGSMIDFYATITPYPLINIEPINVWLGGEVSMAKAAQQAFANMTFDDFKENLRTIFFVDNTSFAISDYLLIALGQMNNSKSYEHLIDKQLMHTIFEAMGCGIQNSPIFTGFVFNTATSTSLVGHEFFRFILNELNALAPWYAQFRIKNFFYGKELFCIQVNLRSTKNDTIPYNAMDLTRTNYEMAFQTPKYKNREGMMKCPTNSLSSSNNEATCQCTIPRSGPFCQFQCTKDQIDDHGGLCGSTQTKCSFDVADYLNSCYAHYDIPVLNGPINVTVQQDLKSINVTWQEALNDAGSVTFTSPEISPKQAPQITAANLQKNQVTVDWLLPGRCPGMIIYYDIEILCNEEMSNVQNQPGNSANISVDCRDQTNGTQLLAAIPESCRGNRNLKVQLRVGTKEGMSPWSKFLPIPDSSWPPAVIAAVALGGFVIAVFLAAFGFYYYYKRVQNYQSVYNTLHNLLHSRRAAGGIGQSFRKLAPQDRTLPLRPITINVDSLGTTKFEPTPQSQSPYNDHPDFRAVNDKFSSAFGSPRSEVDSSSASEHYEPPTFIQ